MRAEKIFIYMDGGMVSHADFARTGSRLLQDGDGGDDIRYALTIEPDDPDYERVSEFTDWFFGRLDG